MKKAKVNETVAASSPGTGGAVKTVHPGESYVPNPAEKSAIDKFHARRDARRAHASLKADMSTGPDGGRFCAIKVDHPDAPTGYTLLMEAVGTPNSAFLGGLLDEIAMISQKGDVVDTSTMNYVLSIVRGIEPNDQVEAMLGTQMAAVHMAMMKFARRLDVVKTIEQQDSAERAFNKLARTFAAQVEALKRYRSKGEQKVIVEHVHVHAGGQAIVGSVSHGGGVDGKSVD